MIKRLFIFLCLLLVVFSSGVSTALAQGEEEEEKDKNPAKSQPDPYYTPPANLWKTDNMEYYVENNIIFYDGQCGSPGSPSSGTDDCTKKIEDMLGPLADKAKELIGEPASSAPPQSGEEEEEGAEEGIGKVIDDKLKELLDGAKDEICAGMEESARNSLAEGLRDELIKKLGEEGYTIDNSVKEELGKAFKDIVEKNVDEPKAEEEEEEGGDEESTPPASSGGSSSGSASGQGSDEFGPNVLAVWDFFVGKGMTPEQAAGIIGNFLVEAPKDGGKDIDPAAGNPAASGGGGGIGQWELDRWNGPNGLYTKYGDPGWKDINNQLEHTWWELNNTERRALNSLKSAKTVADAVNAWLDDFERAGIPHRERRLAEGQRVFDALNGRAGGSSSGGGTSECEEGGGEEGGGTKACPARSEMADFIIKKGISQGYGSAADTEADIKQPYAGVHAGVHDQIVCAIYFMLKDNNLSTLHSSVWNRGHDDDGLDHPNGYAADLSYVVGDSEGEKVADYFASNASALGISQLIFMRTNGNCVNGGKAGPCFSQYDASIGHTDHMHVAAK